MTQEEWKTINNFTPKEKWGDPYRMDYKLLLYLDDLRKFLNKKIIVHCGYEEREKGFHPKGMAVDFHIEGMELSKSFSIINKLWWFGGMGVYPYWNSPGFHLDIGNYRRWWRNKEGVYLPVSIERRDDGRY